MNVGLLFRFLIGERQAVLDVAATPRAILPAFLFVLSAGLAREYDGESIVHAPWHFARPLALSAITATVLFLVVHALTWLHRGRGEGTPPGLGRAYVRFLTVFWWTAPLAWLYAVPYERFLTDVESVKVNLATLAFVALWRVVLMMRVVTLVYGVRWVNAIFLVMAFADALALFAAFKAPGPVLGLMGGVRYGERDQVLADARGIVLSLSLLSAPVWFFGGFAQLAVLRPRWPDWSARKPAELLGVVRLALASVLVWIPILPFTQPEQALRMRTENLWRSGRIREAVELMSAHAAGDYPPLWDPPPRTGFGRTPGLDDLVPVLIAHPPAEWVQARYVAKLENRYEDWQRTLEDWTVRPMALEFLDLEGALLGMYPIVHHHPEATNEQRAAIRSLLEEHLENAPPATD